MVITNTGSAVLDGPFTITSSQLGTLTFTGTLNPHQSMTQTATYNIIQSDLDHGSLTIEATATTIFQTTNVTSGLITLVVPAVQTPQLTLSVISSILNYQSVGQVITYTYTMTNTGNVTLVSPFTLTSDLLTIVVPPTPTLVLLRFFQLLPIIM